VELSGRYAMTRSFLIISGERIAENICAGTGMKGITGDDAALG